MLSDDEIWSRWKFPADWSWKQSVINLARVIEREARRQALEDAACILDAVDNYANPLTSRDCADAIRALKDQS